MRLSTFTTVLFLGRLVFIYLFIIIIIIIKQLITRHNVNSVQNEIIKTKEELQARFITTSYIYNLQVMVE